MPFHRYLNCVWKWCIEHIPPDDVEEWIRQMNEPLPGASKKPTPAQAQDEGDGFMAAMAMFGGGG